MKTISIFLLAMLAIPGNAMAFKEGQRKGDVMATELYDYKSDPLETINLAKSPDHAMLLKQLIEKAADFADKHMELSWNL